LDGKHTQHQYFISLFPLLSLIFQILLAFLQPTLDIKAEKSGSSIKLEYKKQGAAVNNMKTIKTILS
jgi:hypothetical protein